ncbi:phage regulatory CII family protein [Pseudomonas alliivorans]|uniref:phage regulatory CII family protein n=1 Tax=Pseudomonas alliivorans TaxID=2810613 RepID=UPI001AE685CD|nr:phage regulatory CII family protein [Pseudomonas alliivorans]MBP0943112.1 phage regulatory CII family protein [Pseudomonas alliivorans]MEE4881208.1 phage regulatory CII family protein [Pseudomonas alliivorans]MEE4932512.1 phage regulatory CII family protein [Pseudomonas alliivorans]MEE4937975.1 phage regulatory CII family protein [Pseudomonas alliivorans]MEE4943092.1 phage regulatory CII family protein [Pseudomonas alliivorans]
MEDFLRACQSAVLENDAKPLAARMGLAHISLLQRANPDNDAHHLTIEHLYGLLLHTGDMRPLIALADAFGYTLTPHEPPPATDLNTAMIRLHAELADVTRLAFDAQAIGRVSVREKSQLLKEADEVMVGLEVFKQSVRAA